MKFREQSSTTNVEGEVMDPVDRQRDQCLGSVTECLDFVMNLRSLSLSKSAFQSEGQPCFYPKLTSGVQLTQVTLRSGVTTTSPLSRGMGRSIAATEVPEASELASSRSLASRTEPFIINLKSVDPRRRGVGAGQLSKRFKGVVRGTVAPRSVAASLVGAQSA